MEFNVIYDSQSGFVRINGETYPKPITRGVLKEFVMSALDGGWDVTVTTI